MGEDSQVTALTTACDDLQAQLEAGDRSVRHIHHDLAELGAVLASVSEHMARLAGVMEHMTELRANLAEQRKALREVRAAGTRLCASVTRMRERMATLAEETRSFDENHASAATTADRPERPDIFDLQPSTVEAADRQSPDVEIDN